MSGRRASNTLEDVAWELTLGLESKSDYDPNDFGSAATHQRRARKKKPSDATLENSNSKADKRRSNNKAATAVVADEPVRRSSKNKKKKKKQRRNQKKLALSNPPQGSSLPSSSSSPLSSSSYAPFNKKEAVERVLNAAPGLPEEVWALIFQNYLLQPSSSNDFEEEGSSSPFFPLKQQPKQEEKGAAKGRHHLLQRQLQLQTRRQHAATLLQVCHHWRQLVLKLRNQHRVKPNQWKLSSSVLASKKEKEDTGLLSSSASSSSVAAVSSSSSSPADLPSSAISASDLSVTSSFVGGGDPAYASSLAAAEAYRLQMTSKKNKNNNNSNNKTTTKHQIILDDPREEDTKVSASLPVLYGEEGEELLFLSRYCQRLQRLDLSCCWSITDATRSFPCSRSSTASSSSFFLSYCLQRMPYLRELSLQSCHFLQEGMLRELPSTVQVLDLSFCSQLYDHALTCLATLSSLTALDLSHCHGITAEGVRALPSSLTALNLSNCFGVTLSSFVSYSYVDSSCAAEEKEKEKEIDEVEQEPEPEEPYELRIERFSSHLKELFPKLQYLDISGLRVDQNALFSLRGMTCLQTLIMHDPLFLHLPEQLQLCDCLPESLIRLEMSNVEFVEYGTAFLRRLTSLRFLSLLGCHIGNGDETDEALAPLSGLKELRCLTLAGSKVYDRDVACFPRSVTALDLSQCNYLSSVAMSILPPHLKRLKISSCRRLDDNALKGLPSGLEELDLEDCYKSFTGATFKHLPQSLKVLNVVNLPLLSDESLMGLPKGLQHLYLLKHARGISKATLRRLHPRLQIHLCFVSQPS